MSELSEKMADAVGESAADPLSAAYSVRQSQSALAADQLDAALEAIQQALSITPDLPAAQYQMAYVLRAQSAVAGELKESLEESLEESLDWYARAFLRQPVLGDSMGWCRVMVLGFARYAQAMPIAEFWTLQRPEEAIGWFMYGTCRLAVQQPASMPLLRAWALDSSIVDLPNNLGGAYLLEGDLVQAEYWLAVALDRQPVDENTLSNVALLRRIKAAQSTSSQES
jgi:tetratricopeptide (TPR) repeat protein